MRMEELTAEGTIQEISIITSHLVCYEILILPKQVEKSAEILPLASNQLVFNHL